MTSPGMAILGGPAFVKKNTREGNGKLVRGLKSNETDNIPESAALAAVDLIVHRVMPSERKLLSGVFEPLRYHFLDFRCLSLPIQGNENACWQFVATCSTIERVCLG